MFPRFPTYVILIHQRHRQTDGRTTCNLNTALCTSASRGKNRPIYFFKILAAVFCPKNLATVQKYCFARLRGSSPLTPWGSILPPLPRMPIMHHSSSCEPAVHACCPDYCSDDYVMDSALPGMHYRPSEVKRHSLLFIETCLGSSQSSETRRQTAAS